ncbi:hypothetical protein [Streptomyces sp. NPDC048425]|uniref:hypothetical protein n=1 Tax=Streptomyces sp. NPDC048425 TaxID=3365548 RepID=UPI00371DCF46
MAAGAHHALALTDEGRVIAWGRAPTCSRCRTWNRGRRSSPRCSAQSCHCASFSDQRRRGRP